MLITKNRSSPATAVRSSEPHSMMIAASKSPSTRGAIVMAGTPANCISGGGAGSALTTSACFPIARSAQAIASCEPIESPSGRECDDSTNRCRARIAATIAWSGALLVISRMAARFDLVEELLDPVLPGDRFVVHERHVRRPLQAQPRSDLAAEGRR